MELDGIDNIWIGMMHLGKYNDCAGLQQIGG